MISRRQFLKAAGAVAVVSACGGTSQVIGRSRPTPIEHVLIACQENRSFDHYYGFAQFVGQYGVPPGYGQPDGRGATVVPHHLGTLATEDIDHTWSAIHAEFNGGKMDGFARRDGPGALGYYTEADLPFYYSLFGESALCVNYFSSVLGPTVPNRLYMAAGTSGGITTNALSLYGQLEFPTVLDLLDAAGVSWKVYNFGPGSVNNVFRYFRKRNYDAGVLHTSDDYFRDLRSGTLPSVSYLVPSFLTQQDEHPPASIALGMQLQQQLITALRRSSAWSKSAYVLTYDEAGGFFDHVSPPQVDAFGLGVRVPVWIVSPFAKKGHLEPAPYDHTSVLRFMQRVFELPTLASINHQFDTSTPTGSEYEAGGAPAPPRDSRPDLGDLMECFAF